MSMPQAVAGGACPETSWGSADPRMSAREAWRRGQRWLWPCRVWAAAGLALTEAAPRVWGRWAAEQVSGHTVVAGPMGGRQRPWEDGPGTPAVSEPGAGKGPRQKDGLWGLGLAASALLGGRPVPQSSPRAWSWELACWAWPSVPWALGTEHLPLGWRVCVPEAIRYPVPAGISEPGAPRRGPESGAPRPGLEPGRGRALTAFLSASPRLCRVCFPGSLPHRDVPEDVRPGAPELLPVLLQLLRLWGECGAHQGDS